MQSTGARRRLQSLNQPEVNPARHERENEQQRAKGSRKRQPDYSVGLFVEPEELSPLEEPPVVCGSTVAAGFREPDGGV